MATKVSISNLSELKSTLDDHLPVYLTSPNLPSTSGAPLSKTHRFSESNFHATVRLILGYSAVGLALYIFYLDYYLKLPWLEHKVVTFWCVLGYSVLNAGVMFWTWKYERGLVFEGKRNGGPAKDGKEGAKGGELKIRSRLPHKKYDPTYRIKVDWRENGKVSSQARKEGKAKELTAPFTSFFQADGTFVSGEFERWLKGKLPEVLGKDEAMVVESKVAERQNLTLDAKSNPSLGNSLTDAGSTGSAKKRSKNKS